MQFIHTILDTPWGCLKILHDEQHIHQALFTTSKLTVSKQTKFCNKIAVELEAYYQNPFHRFQLALKPQGTPFQQKVWNELLVIPTGRTLTYGELALKLSSSPRAVGQACKMNPITLLIPCHRVIGKNGFGGYMGRKEAIQFKIDLLKHEGNCFTFSS